MLLGSWYYSSIQVESEKVMLQACIPPLLPQVPADSFPLASQKRNPIHWWAFVPFNGNILTEGYDIFLGTRAGPDTFPANICIRRIQNYLRHKTVRRCGQWRVAEPRFRFEINVR
jgi:hypothetical protein